MKRANVPRGDPVGAFQGDRMADPVTGRFDAKGIEGAGRYGDGLSGHDPEILFDFIFLAVGEGDPIAGVPDLAEAVFGSVELILAVTTSIWVL